MWQHLQGLAELRQAALGGAVGGESGGGPSVRACAIHVEDVAPRALIPHHPDRLQGRIAFFLEAHLRSRDATQHVCDKVAHKSMIWQRGMGTAGASSACRIPAALAGSFLIKWPHGECC